MTEFNKRVAAYVDGDEARVKALALEFGCSLQTVRRWVTGENEPHEAFQPKVLAFIEKGGK